MDLSKNTIIAFILIGVVLLISSSDFYQRLAGRNKREVVTQRQIADSTATGSEIVDLEEKDLDTATESRGLREPTTDTTPAVESRAHEDARLGRVARREETITTIETDLYVARFSSLGGSIIEWRLKKFHDPDSNNVNLIWESGAGNTGFSLVTTEDSLTTGALPFELIEDEYDPVLPSSRVLRYRLRFSGGGEITKEFRFEDGSYHVDMKVEATGFGRFPAGSSYWISWVGGVPPTERNVGDDMRYAKAYALFGETLEEFEAKDGTKQFSGNLTWSGVRNKYFSVAMIPGHAGSGHRSSGTSKEWEVNCQGREFPYEKKTKLKEYGISIGRIILDSDISETVRFYLGPLDYNVVTEYNVGLDRMMNFGWQVIRPISKLILWSLKALYKIIPNYGWVIVIFSIFIKIVLYPLTHKSYSSMKEMQKLQPEIARLKEKYGNDRERLNKETMKLYKEHSVNPLGGCLPMFLQMPLLYALFAVFRSTIEFRMAGFIGWITDLSAPDTVATLPFALPLYGDHVNILPLFMGGTMFFQQLMSAKDQQQKMMAYMMPIMFTLLFNNFPSGLTLYYSLFNLFTIFQQKMIKDKTPEPKIEQPTKGRKK